MKVQHKCAESSRGSGKGNKEMDWILEQPVGTVFGYSDGSAVYIRVTEDFVVSLITNIVYRTEAFRMSIKDITYCTFPNAYVVLGDPKSL